MLAVGIQQNKRGKQEFCSYITWWWIPPSASFNNSCFYDHWRQQKSNVSTSHKHRLDGRTLLFFLLITGNLLIGKSIFLCDCFTTFPKCQELMLRYRKQKVITIKEQRKSKQYSGILEHNKFY